MESALVVAVTIVAVRVVSTLIARRDIIGLSKMESRLSPAMGLNARGPSVGAETR
jgi:hypothetical protein